jgi:hypothetical protein
MLNEPDRLDGTRNTLYLASDNFNRRIDLSTMELEEQWSICVPGVVWVRYFQAQYVVLSGQE